MALQPQVSEKDHIQGSKQAEVTIVEYGDYQCPHCGTAHPTLKRMMAELGDQIKFVFRHFPLAESHPYARAAALTAEAAGMQGKFWEMHDALYENQHYLNEQLFSTLAEQLHLNMEQFQADIKKQAISEKVESDFESGMRSGVNGTPTFFVNGEKFDGGAEDLLQMLKEN